MSAQTCGCGRTTTLAEAIARGVDVQRGDPGDPDLLLYSCLCGSTHAFEVVPRLKLFLCRGDYDDQVELERDYDDQVEDEKEEFPT